MEFQLNGEGGSVRTGKNMINPLTPSNPTMPHSNPNTAATTCFNTYTLLNTSTRDNDRVTLVVDVLDDIPPFNPSTAGRINKQTKQKG